jgi:hypothetical protein
MWVLVVNADGVTFGARVHFTRWRGHHSIIRRPIAAHTLRVLWLQLSLPICTPSPAPSAICPFHFVVVCVGRYHRKYCSPLVWRLVSSCSAWASLVSPRWTSLRIRCVVVPCGLVVLAANGAMLCRGLHVQSPVDGSTVLTAVDLDVGLTNSHCMVRLFDFMELGETDQQSGLYYGNTRSIVPHPSAVGRMSSLRFVPAVLCRV